MIFPTSGTIPVVLIGCSSPVPNTHCLRLQLYRQHIQIWTGYNYWAIMPHRTCVPSESSRFVITICTLCWTIILAPATGIFCTMKKRNLIQWRSNQSDSCWKTGPQHQRIRPDVDSVWIWSAVSAKIKRYWQCRALTISALRICPGRHMAINGTLITITSLLAVQWQGRTDIGRTKNDFRLALVSLKHPNDLQRSQRLHFVHSVTPNHSSVRLVRGRKLPYS